MNTISVTSTQKITFHTFSNWISNHLFEIFLIIYGIWVIIPWFAPVIMELGFTSAGNAIYFFYSFFCHQLPQRSIFLFGEQSMYSLSEIQTVWQNTSNPMILRQFIGNEAMGWKVAWSDRMVSFYTIIWVFAVIFYWLRNKAKAISIWMALLLLMPMILDGGTHMISDFSGIGNGFRDTNLWLAQLTNNSFSQNFYSGDGIGSFNSWARWITGILAGLAIVWLALPNIFEIQTLNKKLDELSVENVLRKK
ncbi:MAG TPA: hypothetical protein DIW23_12725 [Anaerolineae bacterium]|nr:hypothetical protein [Anaerolineae bacterium]